MKTPAPCQTMHRLPRHVAVAGQHHLAVAGGADRLAGGAGQVRARSERPRSCRCRPAGRRSGWRARLERHGEWPANARRAEGLVVGLLERDLVERHAAPGRRRRLEEPGRDRQRGGGEAGRHQLERRRQTGGRRPSPPPPPGRAPPRWGAAPPPASAPRRPARSGAVAPPARPTAGWRRHAPRPAPRRRGGPGPAPPRRWGPPAAPGAAAGRSWRQRRLAARPSTLRSFSMIRKYSLRVYGRLRMWKSFLARPTQPKQ